MSSKKRIPWNKGLKLSKMPQYSNMGFQKGNKLWEHENACKNRFKKGERPSQETEFKKGHIPWVKGRKGFLAGENHYKWIEDRSKLKRYNDDAKDRRSYAYSNWRKNVWERDNYTCKIANNDCEGRIECHHILSYSEYPELRYDINNGITLCHAHHPRKRAEEKRLISTFQELVSVSSDIN